MHPYTDAGCLKERGYHPDLNEILALVPTLLQPSRKCFIPDEAFRVHRISPTSLQETSSPCLSFDAWFTKKWE